MASDDFEDLSRRRVLGRDSLIILAGVLLALFAAQVFLPRTGGVAAASPTDLPSGVITGSLPPPVSLPPGATFGPIVDPSIGLDASATPIPVITMGPTPSPSLEPSPSASVKPSGSPKPTVKPSATPTHSTTPTLTPTLPPTPGPTPPPPPTVNVSCSPPVGLTVDCNVSVSHIQPDSETWSVSEGGTLVSGGTTFLTARYEFAAPGDYTITVTVTGLDSSVKSDSLVVTVTGP